MKTIYRLLRLRFLSPYSLLLLYKAKKKHGNNLCFLLKFAADYYGSKRAVTDGTTWLNFKELYEKVLQLSFLIDKKINPVKNATAILVCNNSINHVLTLYALQNMGMKLVLVNDKQHLNDIHKIIKKQPGPCYIFSSSTLIENTINIDTLIAEIVNDRKEQLFSRDLATVIFPTSGTTGEAKLIEKKKGEFYWLQSFADLVKRTSIDKRKAVYISIPIAHGFGYTTLLFTLILGKKAVMAGNKNIEQAAALLVAEQSDLLVGVPTALYKMAEKLEGTDHPVHSIISGGAAMSLHVFNKLTQTISKNIFSMYGSTEASTSFIADYTALRQNSAALGTPLKGVRYQLKELKNGAKELLIQSGLSNTTATAGWLHTGDLAEEDPNGNIIWCSRKDDMIIKSGVNIYPVEIEKELLQINEIEDAYVAGEKDDIKGEIIIAFVKMKNAVSFDEKPIIEKLKEVLPGIKIPDKIYFLDYFQYTSTGKKIRPVAANIKTAAQ